MLTEITSRNGQEMISPKPTFVINVDTKPTGREIYRSTFRLCMMASGSIVIIVKRSLLNTVIQTGTLVQIMDK